MLQELNLSIFLCFNHIWAIFNAYLRNTTSASKKLNITFVFHSSLAPGTQPPSALHSLHTGEDVLGSYLYSFYPTAPLWVSLKGIFHLWGFLKYFLTKYNPFVFSLDRALQLVSTPSKLTPPFPQMFSPLLDAQGFLQSHTPPSGCKHILPHSILIFMYTLMSQGQFRPL